MLLAGRALQRDGLVGFGRQTAAWGLVDGAIAGAGTLGRRRRGELTPEEQGRKARSLGRLLLINAAADVGYMVGGAVIALRSREGRPVRGMNEGDGAAIVVQGAFLLALDVSQAMRLRMSG
jgi:hypothetical protein